MEPSVKQVLASRGLGLPTEDEAPLQEYWTNMRQLRAQVDEGSLADHEIAVTWSAVAEEGS